MDRKQIIAVWFGLLIAVPIFLLVLLIDATVGADGRAKSICLGFDETGNAMFGGDPTMTISTRVGNGVILGYRWAKLAAPVIDFLFGAGHCAANATIKG